MAQSGQPTNEDPARCRWPPLPGYLPKIHKVPELLLREEQNYHDYIPQVVSIGPYHHGKLELRLAESVKPMTLGMVLSVEKERQDYYHKKIRDRIIDIRNCYEEHPTNLYSDDELARMMLLDASFIIIYIETRPPQHHRSAFLMSRALGWLSMSIVSRDIFLLENQIPFWVVKLLLSTRYGEDESQELLNRYLTLAASGEFQLKRSLPLENKEDLHFLEALLRFRTFDSILQPKKTRLSFINCKFFCCLRVKENTIDPRKINGNLTTGPESTEPYRRKSRFRSCVNEIKARVCKRLINDDREDDYAKIDLKKFVHSFRSVTDLKAKGIHFEPSPTPSLKDVQFESNCIYGKLQLPNCLITINTKALFLNMIAYEFSPNSSNQCVMTSYINLMKSLIVRSEDVKELREKKILDCELGDEQVLKLFQDINTYRVTNHLIFQDVKDKIQAHCNSKSKTWIAEFIHTYFHSPWTIITLLAATCLLVLTFLQTIYTVKS